MLVFDLTDINSFLKVRHWLSEIKRMTPENTPLLLVGNKSDMTGKRMVELKEASGFAEKSGLKYFETSAKTGQHVDEAFMTLGKHCLEQAIKDGVGPAPEPDHLPPENPKGWCSC